jgi:hypothetical protein
MVPAAVLGLGLLAAALLLAAEFTSLFVVRIQTTGGVIRTETTGAHNSYALVPIALLAGLLALVVWQRGSRPALLALGLMGLVALLIALLGDLPDAHVTGVVRGNGSSPGGIGAPYVQAATRPSTGFYLETLGAVVLVMASVGSFLLIGPPPRPGALP